MSRKHEPNFIRIDGDVAYIQLTRKDGAVVESKIDAADVDLIRSLPYRWVAAKLYGSLRPMTSVPTESGRKNVLLYRFLLNAPKGSIVDHINGDALDNRRSNLRFVTATENGQNSSKTYGNTPFRGVCWDARRGQYRADLRVNRKPVYIGHFPTSEAANAAVIEARRLHQTHCAENSRPRQEV